MKNALKALPMTCEVYTPGICNSRPLVFIPWVDERGEVQHKQEVAAFQKCFTDWRECEKFIASKGFQKVLKGLQKQQSFFENL